MKANETRQQAFRQVDTFSRILDEDDTEEEEEDLSSDSTSGNASLVLISLASNVNSDSSDSNISEYTAAQSKMPALNKGKRKAKEVVEILLLIVNGEYWLT